MTSRVGLYGICRWDGAPFLHADGSLDQQAIADHARFGTVIVEATPLLQRPEIVAALRIANPDIRVIGFVDLCKAYFSPGHSMDPLHDLTGELFEAVAAFRSQGDGFVWSAKWHDVFDPIRLTGRPIPPENSYSWFGRNLADPVTVLATADVLIRRVLNADLFDGLFADLSFEDIGRTSSDATDLIDFKRAGFATLPDFRAAFRAGHRDLWRRLHDAAPDNFSLGMNPLPGDVTLSAYVNGGMVENFPTAPGDRHDAKAWLEVMQSIWTFERQRGPSAECWINQQPDVGGADWTVEANAQAIGFGLGSALLTDSARFTMSMNGRPDPDGREQRWSPLYDFVAGLGAPLGPAYQMVPQRGFAPWSWAREFASGAITVNPRTRIARFYGVAG